MCFSDDARIPIPAAPDRLGDHGDTVLTAADGTRLGAYRALAAEPSGAGMVILPDVRGLHDFYRALADRFAEHGVHAVAIDYFGRTAGIGARGDDFDYMPHVQSTSPETLRQDIDAAIALLRSPAGGGADDVYTTGFCFGGSISWAQADRPDLGGAIGFYGRPERLPDGFVERVRAPILVLGAGEDPNIPRSEYERFAAELTRAGRDHETRVYDGAPHSFFDRRFGEHAGACRDAWSRILAFVERTRSAGATA